MMLFDFGPKSSILLIFFFNGLLFSFLLFKKGFKDHNNASKWLGLFILLCSFYICPFMLGYAGWYFKKGYREILFFIPFQQLFLIGPILFFYTQSLLNKTFKLSKKEFIHFVPAILYLIYTLVIFVTDELVLDEYYFYADGRDKDLAFWYQMAGLISMLFYLFMSLRYYNIYRNIVVQEVSFADTILFKWVNHYLIAFLVILILRVLFFILNPEWGNFGSKFWYYLCFSVLFFFIAINGFSNTVSATIAFKASLLENNPNLSSMNTNFKFSNGTNDGLDILDIENWKSKILNLMEDDRVYTNPNLTLTDIANKLNTNRNIISGVINQGFEMNFNDFINSQRVDAVIEQLRLGQQNSVTLLGIALECGFNSKATFNRAFKKKTSLTPKEFLAKNHPK